MALAQDQPQGHSDTVLKKPSSSSSDRPGFWRLLRRRERDAVAQSEEGSETEESAKVEESAKPEESTATAPSLTFHGQFIPPVDQVIYERYFGHSLLRGTLPGVWCIRRRGGEFVPVLRRDDGLARHQPRSIAADLPQAMPKPA
ncbi:hypothetical protein HQ394_16095 [Defluviicoccus vanus]|uniref:Uncharacterized protein n=1 Tax=Defluviicoccus vanus TaxID=111831 RepID=A0A7H1MX58_9PROT|nr:hypothetical protein HQ394_16095 [Defluviicoccus vanus]